MEEMGNCFQEKRYSSWRKRKKKIDERDEEIEDPTYIDEWKKIYKFKKHKSPGIYGTTTELIQRAGPTLWIRIYKLVNQGRKKKRQQSGVKA